MKKLLLIAGCIGLSAPCYSQVSYRSTVYKANSYVAPVDLNLLREVNQQKQNTYDNNAAIINERFNSTRKQLQYVPDLNKAQLVIEYNRIAKVAGQYDISDRRVVQYITNALENLDFIIGYVIQNPKDQLADNYFKN